MFTTVLIKIAVHNRQNSDGVNRFLADGQDTKNSTYSMYYIDCYLENSEYAIFAVYRLWISF